MVINLTADKILDQDEFVACLPFGCWHAEDYMKLQAMKEAVTLAAEPKVTNIIRNHSDNVHAAKSFIQHAFPAIQKHQNSSVLTGLRYEFLVIKVLRVLLLLVAGLGLFMIIRASWVMIAQKEVRGRWLGLTGIIVVTLCLYWLLIWLWTAQSRRYYKKLVHAYIVFAASEDELLRPTPLDKGWAPAAWKSVNDSYSSLTINKSAKHEGACDGSNGVWCGSDYFLAASDDNNIVRLFRARGYAKSRDLLNLNDSLGFKQPDGTFRESDLEGAARIGDRIYWIGSHGTNSAGEERKERQIFFATTVTGSGDKTAVQFYGRPYRDLLQDLARDPRLTQFDLGAAAKKPPKDAGALNIESLCAGGPSLYIGFRNPIPNRKALIVPLANPAELVGKNDFTAKFGDPILIDLQGLGIRDMVWWRDSFLIIAGDYRDSSDAEARPSKLFRWEGGTSAPVPLDLEFDDLNPEAAVVYGNDRKKLLLLSDDGIIKGVSQKRLDDSKRSFRSVWLQDLCK